MLWLKGVSVFMIHRRRKIGKAITYLGMYYSSGRYSEKRTLDTLRISITAVFTALVCASTIVLSIYLPATRGYFNIGETMIYITALIFGPYVGAFAGGVGSMLADILLGYGYYAPATLVIKACEGAIVGSLSRRVFASKNAVYWKAFTTIIGIVVGVILCLVGLTYYTGKTELYLGIPPPENPSIILNVSPVFWYGLGLAVTVLIALTGFLFEPEFGWTVVSILAGGLEMVSGYFLYEYFVLIGPGAVAEVPINIGQMVVGLVVAVPVVKVVWRYLPDLRRIT
ncbi:hypothetical protein DRO58_08300 [Candidatus Bathyarchaeota archaeon]|nr:MAG: hypothetical protein DRO58_08300 [Candidatus Bathyarchaeota archaeon]